MSESAKHETAAGGGGDLAALDPGLAIVDCHHHLWHPHAERYLADAFHKEIAESGHAVAATVYIECGVMYRRHGPAPMRPVGEAEFVTGMAAMSDSGGFGPARVCEGFIGAADLMTLGEGVDDVLDALALASAGRFRGLRGSVTWDADPAVNTGTRRFSPPGMLLDPSFRAGVGRLEKRGLVFDAWLYYPQLVELCSLADAFPDLVVVVNHCAGLLGVGPYADAGNFARWRGLVAEAARRPNVRMKLGGLAAARTGFGYERRAARPTGVELAADWKPYIESCVELFGPARCMFESNFPVDKVAGSYRSVWNAFKTIAAGASGEEKRALFSGTAMATYGVKGWGGGAAGG